MSVPSGDYVNYAAGGAACSYANLGGYTDPYSMNVPPQGKVTSGAYIVPVWAPPSYESLAGNSCSGYANIEDAYGKDAARCQTTYRTSLCGNRK